MTIYPVSTTAGGVVIVRPEGGLNSQVAAKLRQQLLDLVNDGSARLVVDLVAVVSIDSSILGTLIVGLKAAKQAGGDLRIAAPSKRVATALELTHLTKVLPAYPTAEDAFAE